MRWIARIKRANGTLTNRLQVESATEAKAHERLGWLYPGGELVEWRPWDETIDGPQLTVDTKLIVNASVVAAGKAKVAEAQARRDEAREVASQVVRDPEQSVTHDHVEQLVSDGVDGLTPGSTPAPPRPAK